MPSSDVASPPSDEEAERCLLGCVLLDPEATAARVVPALSGSDFYGSSSRRLVLLLASLLREGSTPERRFVHDRIAATGNGHAEEDAAYLATCLESVSSARNADHYLNRVRETARRRDLYELGQSIAQGIEARLPAKLVADDAKQRLELHETIAGSDSLDWQDISDFSRVVTPPEWLWENVVAKKRVTLVAGDAKAGKTWLVTGWMGRVTRGLDWLGHPAPDHPLRLCYVSEEGIDDVYARCLRFGAKIQDLLPRGSVPVGTDWPTLVESASKRAVSVGADAVVFDTLSHLAHIEDENDAHAVNDALDPLLYCAEKFNLALVPIHHFGRSGNIRGSTAFEANPDLLLRFKHHGQPGSRQRLMEFSGRFQATDPTVVEYHQGTGPGEFDSYSVVHEQPESEQDMLVDQLILRMLDREGTFVPGRLIPDEIGRRKAIVLDRLESLASSKKIQRQGRGNRASPFTYAALNVSVPTSPEPNSEK